MKIARLPVAFAVAASVLSAGCFGGPQNSNAQMSALLPATHGMPHYRLPNGIDTRAGGLSRLSPQFLSPQISASPEKSGGVEREFFVSAGPNNVFVFNNSNYARVGDITGALVGADGIWVDKNGNVYVANCCGGADVLEYKKGGGSPICTYSSGLMDPIDGTTDRAGNVYVADLSANAINEYAQCSNTVKATFSISQPSGVAVDSKGDVFVEYSATGFVGNFEEFTNGIGKILGATTELAAGFVIDKNGNLIADDQSGSIDLIKPPYSSAKVLVSGLADPFQDSLNSAENLLFNANTGLGFAPTVTVYSYPSMSLVRTISLSSVIQFEPVLGVGESPNAVF